MGRPIDSAKEFWIAIYLRNHFSHTLIAELVGCSRMTVRSIQRGCVLRAGQIIDRARVIKRKRADDPDEMPGPRPCEPYICPGCSDAAGRIVLVTLDPCVACQARQLREQGLAKARAKAEARARHEARMVATTAR